MTKHRYIYLLQTFDLNTSRNVYKFGKTKRHPITRMSEYDPCNKIIFILAVDDCDDCEKQILSVMRNDSNLEKLPKKREYFYCDDYEYVIKLIMSHMNDKWTAESMYDTDYDYSENSISEKPSPKKTKAKKAPIKKKIVKPKAKPPAKKKIVKPKLCKADILLPEVESFTNHIVSHVSPTTMHKDIIPSDKSAVSMFRYWFKNHYGNIDRYTFSKDCWAEIFNKFKASDEYSYIEHDPILYMRDFLHLMMKIPKTKKEKISMYQHLIIIEASDDPRGLRCRNGRLNSDKICIDNGFGKIFIRDALVHDKINMDDLFKNYHIYKDNIIVKATLKGIEYSAPIPLHYCTIYDKNVLSVLLYDGVYVEFS